MASNITSLLNEERVFHPPARFQEKARIRSLEEYEKQWKASVENPVAYWEKEAKELHWNTPWTKAFTDDDLSFKWFEDGTLNASYNCLDVHLPKLKDKIALHWIGERGEKRSYTYQKLKDEVCRFANLLESWDIKQGDVVTIYLPMLPEMVVAMLGCARVGAMHNVVFAGFSAEALGERIRDSRSKVVVTSDVGWRKGIAHTLKEKVDQSLTNNPQVERVLIYNHGKTDYPKTKSRDVDWEEATGKLSITHQAKFFPAENPLFLLYTSGSTGKPKGILHTTGGYLVGAKSTAKYVFDFQDSDIFWCTADCGWITGHSYIVYGPMSHGVTTVIYEGSFDTPNWGRCWEILQNFKVTKFYTAPTAIRAFMAQGNEWPNKYDLSSLTLLGSVGEPINPEAWMWYHTVVGKSECPIVDTWWQTETGTMMIAPIPGATPLHPGSATRPLFGIDPEIVDEVGNPVPENTGGYLVVKKPWPSIMRTIFGDHERYKKQYWQKIAGVYFTGDGARKDAHGNFWIMGRIDDVMNVAGHRLSTMEIESALVGHPLVYEVATVGIPDSLKGEAIVCFVVLKGKQTSDASLEEKLKQHVVDKISAIARPAKIHLVASLPKTRSGKIMRRLLKDVAQGKEFTGDTSTLEG